MVHIYILAAVLPDLLFYFPQASQIRQTDAFLVKRLNNFTLIGIQNNNQRSTYVPIKKTFTRLAVFLDVSFMVQERSNFSAGLYFIDFRQLEQRKQFS